MDIWYDVEQLKRLAESCDNPEKEKKYKKICIELLQQEVEDLEGWLSESPEEAAEIISYIQPVRAEIKRLSKHERWKPGAPRRKEAELKRVSKLLAAGKGKTTLETIAYESLVDEGLTPEQISAPIQTRSGGVTNKWIQKVGALRKLKQRSAKK